MARAAAESSVAGDRLDRIDPRLDTEVRRHEPVLSAIATRLCRDPADARDLVQDTFERAVRAWSRLPEDANVRAWLITILNRLFIDRCRRTRRTTPIDADVVPLEVPCAEPAAPPAWARVTAEQLARAVERLDDEFRRAYELHAIQGRSYKEIAAALEIPPSTVGTRLLRARRKLRDLLMQELATQEDAP